MKIIKKIYIKFCSFYSIKLVKWLGIPVVLLIFWFSFSIIFNSNVSLSVLQHNHFKDEDNDFNTGKLLKGEKVIGSFVSREDNLGIVAIRVGNVPDVEFNDEDKIIFRIREGGNSKILYENNYRSGIFKSNRYFPFGFEQINNSKGKKYYFEVISLKGNDTNSIEVENSNPLYITKYQLSRNEILNDYFSMFKFGKNFFIYFFTNIDNLLYSTIFFFPFATYIVLILFPFDKFLGKPKKIKLKKVFLLFVLGVIFVDSLLIELMVTGIIITIVCFWVLAIYKNKYKSKFSFILSLSLILISIINIYFNLGFYSEKISTYAYLFLVVGFIQHLIEYRYSISS